MTWYCRIILVRWFSTKDTKGENTELNKEFTLLSLEVWTSLLVCMCVYRNSMSKGKWCTMPLQGGRLVKQLTTLFVNFDKRFVCMLSFGQCVALPLETSKKESNTKVILRGAKSLTFTWENTIRPFPLTNVAWICKITASTVYALLQPYRVHIIKIIIIMLVYTEN